MSILKHNDGKKYKTIKHILDEFKILTKNGNPFNLFLKGYYEIKQGKHKGDRILFFHAPKENEKGIWTTLKNNEWLNIPNDNKWNVFTQVQLNKKVNPFIKSFITDNVDKKEQVVFMREKDGFHFYGIYKASLDKLSTRICIYNRLNNKLDTNDWI